MSKERYFAITVPVFQHYLYRISTIAARTDAAAQLDYRVTTGMFSAGQNLMTAQGFVPRILTPLCGHRFAPLPDGPATSDLLIARGTLLQNDLSRITPAQFAEADQKEITHDAGNATLRQSAETFVTLYGMPNFFFHLVAGYSALRAAGVPLSKGDFDGFHSYPTGFSFDDTRD